MPPTPKARLSLLAPRWKPQSFWQRLIACSLPSGFPLKSMRASKAYSWPPMHLDRGKAHLAALEKELADIESAFFLFRWINADLIASLRVRINHARELIDFFDHTR